MLIELQQVTQEIDLGDYFEGYRGQIVHVWVNPPRIKLEERRALKREASAWIAQQVARIQPVPKKSGPLAAVLGWMKKTPDAEADRLQRLQMGWMAENWSQHPDPETHWTVAELIQLEARDPRLYEWMVRKSIALIEGYRADEKKA